MTLCMAVRWGGISYAMLQCFRLSHRMESHGHMTMTETILPMERLQVHRLYMHTAVEVRLLLKHINTYYLGARKAVAIRHTD